jgi:predicted amidohydrolase
MEREAMTVGLLQADLRWRDPEANRVHLEALLEAGYRGANMVVMPETFTTGFLGEGDSSDEGMSGATVAWMSALAARFGCVVTGSAVIASRAGRRNRLLWAEPGGAVRHYDKRHLFSYAGEHRRYEPGKRRRVFGYRGWRTCPQVCYDIRFPVWCRNRNDYDLMLVVANWPAPRIEAWSALLAARAIENQAYVVAVNRVGEDGQGRHYTGQSVVHGPLGETLLRLDQSEAYAETDLSLDHLQSVRAELPFLSDADRFEISC